MTRLTYHLPNFTYPDTDSDGIFDVVVQQAREAEDAGFDRVTVMDHFYQLPGIGQHDEPMLEAYTTLAALAQHTSAVQLATLVTGNTYRNPALLAKAVTTLDVVSGGRAQLGIGAGWFELEHESLGFEFQTFTDRFEKLEESLRIVGPMLRGEPVSMEGERYRVADAVNHPLPVTRIPIMIGGSGEKKTLRMVAQYADESNLVGITAPDQIQRKFDALDGHCERLGRDRDEIRVSVLLNVVVAETHEQAEADLGAYAAMKGFPPELVERVRSMTIFGDPDTVGEQLSAYAATGIDGIAPMLLANGHVPGRIALLGQVADDALG